MRHHWQRGRSLTANQIVVRCDRHKSFTLTEGGNVWLAVPGLERRSLVKIPLNTTVAPTGTLRLRSPQGRRLWQADHAGAINIEQRDGDSDIALYTPHERVKQILLDRAGRRRTRLPVQDSSTQLCRCGERNIQPRSTLSNE
ncbi:hypothetical protein [Saccharopolyspora antimicrobica]|nr:hypothetical protein [Saccharopolyspora antimicrobica]